MSENWCSYFCNVNSKLASIRVDLGIRSMIPDSSRAWLLWVWVYFKHPRPDGLSSTEEFGRLCHLEDELQAALERKCGAVLSGCITTEGRREFYFYGSNPDGFEETVNRCVGKSQSYNFDCNQQHDPTWTQYLNVLYPSEEQRERIENQRLMDRMREKGDTLEVPRIVRHWIYFKTQDDRASFQPVSQELGYRIESQTERADNEYPYCICISRNQLMTSDAVDDAVIELFRAAKFAHGEYNGWECELLLDNSSDGGTRNQSGD